MTLTNPIESLSVIIPIAIVLALAIAAWLIPRMFKRTARATVTHAPPKPNRRVDHRDHWQQDDEEQPAGVCICGAPATRALPTTGRSVMDKLPGMRWFNRLQGQPDKLTIVTGTGQLVICERCLDVAAELLNAEHLEIRQATAQHNARMRGKLLALEHGGLARALAETIQKAQEHGS